jgi:hypothetical protein
MTLEASKQAILAALTRQTAPQDEAVAWDAITAAVASALKERDQERLERRDDPSGKGRVEFYDGLLSNIERIRAEVGKLSESEYLRTPLGLMDAMEWEDHETGVTERMVEWSALQFNLRLQRRRLFTLQNKIKQARDYAQTSVKNQRPPSSESFFLDRLVYALGQIAAVHVGMKPAFSNGNATVFEDFVRAVTKAVDPQLKRSTIKSAIGRLDAKRNRSFSRDLEETRHRRDRPTSDVRKTFAAYLKSEGLV